MNKTMVNVHVTKFQITRFEWHSLLFIVLVKNRWFLKKIIHARYRETFLIKVLKHK